MCPHMNIVQSSPVHREVMKAQKMTTTAYADVFTRPSFRNLIHMVAINANPTDSLLLLPVMVIFTCDEADRSWNGKGSCCSSSWEQLVSNICRASRGILATLRQNCTWVTLF